MASAGATLRVRGLTETIRAFNKINREVSKAIVGEELLKAAEPVALAAREKIARYPGASTSTIGPRVSGQGVFVTQRARKVTGQRGDFGKLQMRHMLAALFEHENDVVEAIEDALDRITDSAGF